MNWQRVFALFVVLGFFCDTTKSSPILYNRGADGGACGAKSRIFVRMWGGDEQQIAKLSRMNDTLIETLENRVLDVLYAPDKHPPKRKVTVTFQSMDGIAYTTDDDINISLKFLSDIGFFDDRDGSGEELEGVLVHELVHVYQNARGGASGGLVEGVADYVRNKVQRKLRQRTGFMERWDAGYQATAQFLEWIASTTNDATFVQKLNEGLAGDEDDVRVSIAATTGKDIEVLFGAYQEGISV